MFEAIKTIGQTFTNNLIKLFDQYGFDFFFVYFKDEESNLNVMTTTLKSIMRCEVIGLDESFQTTCFGFFSSKVCQYVIIDEKVCKNLKFVSIKSTQLDFKKCITCLNFFEKGRHECNKTCLNLNVHPRKLNILLKKKRNFIFFTNYFLIFFSSSFLFSHVS